MKTTALCSTNKIRKRTINVSNKAEESEKLKAEVNELYAYTCTTNIFSNSGACLFISLMSFGEQRFLIFNFHEVQFINFFSLMVYSFCILKTLQFSSVQSLSRVQLFATP